jgi:hypothetical protein
MHLHVEIHATAGITLRALVRRLHDAASVIAGMADTEEEIEREQVQQEQLAHISESPQVARAMEAVRTGDVITQPMPDMEPLGLVAADARASGPYAGMQLDGMQPPAARDYAEMVRQGPPPNYVQSMLSPEMQEKVDKLLKQATMPGPSLVSPLQGMLPDIAIDPCTNCSTVGYPAVQAAMRNPAFTPDVLKGWYHGASYAGVVKPCEGCRVRRGLLNAPETRKLPK